MLKASFVTSATFFCSIRADSGKASLVASLAAFNAASNKQTAVIDADSEFPLKLKEAFGPSVQLYEYDDIFDIVRTQNASRFQKTVYFAETTKISYFPAHHLTDAAELFLDTAMRDFFMQLCAAFEIVLVNFAAGPMLCERVSDILGKIGLWRRNRPNFAIVSLSDERSLIELDNLLKHSSGLAYQIQENALLLFNKVPASAGEQKIADNTLNTSELRKLFIGVNHHIVGINDEFTAQKSSPFAFVSSQKSRTNRIISVLNRAITGKSRESAVSKVLPGDFAPLLDGKILQALSPYIDKIRIAAAAKLFLPPSRVQVFLEENESSLRIRIRLSNERQTHLGILKTFDFITKTKPIMLSPSSWPFIDSFKLKGTFSPIDKADNARLSVKAVYRFSDSFAGQCRDKPIKEPDYEIQRQFCLSPLVFELICRLDDIPSLRDLLSFGKGRFKPLSFACANDMLNSSDLTQFLVPSSYKLNISLSCLCRYQEFYDFFIKTAFSVGIKLLKPERASFAEQAPIEISNGIFDIFARNASLSFVKDFKLQPPLEKAVALIPAARAYKAAIAQVLALTPCGYVKHGQKENTTLSLYESLIPETLPLKYRSLKRFLTVYDFKFFGFRALKPFEAILNALPIVSEPFARPKSDCAFELFGASLSKKLSLKIYGQNEFKPRYGVIKAPKFTSPTCFGFACGLRTGFEYKAALLKRPPEHFAFNKPKFNLEFAIKTRPPEIRISSALFDKTVYTVAFSPKCKFQVSYKESAQKPSMFFCGFEHKSMLRYRFASILSALKRVPYGDFMPAKSLYGDILQVRFKHIKLSDYLLPQALWQPTALDGTAKKRALPIFISPSVRRLSIIKAQCSKGLVKGFKTKKTANAKSLQADKPGFRLFFTAFKPIKLLREPLNILGEGAKRLSIRELGLICSFNIAKNKILYGHDSIILSVLPVRTGRITMRFLISSAGLEIIKCPPPLKEALKAQISMFCLHKCLYRAITAAPKAERYSYRLRLKKNLVLDSLLFSHKAYADTLGGAKNSSPNILQKSESLPKFLLKKPLEKENSDSFKNDYKTAFNLKKQNYSAPEGLRLICALAPASPLKQRFPSAIEELYKQLLSNSLLFLGKKLPTRAVKKTKRGYLGPTAVINTHSSLPRQAFLLRPENQPQRLLLQFSRNMFKVRKISRGDIRALMQSATQRFNLVSNRLSQ